MTQAQTASRPVTRAFADDGDVGRRSRSRRTAVIFRSPHPDIVIPDVSITQFVLRHADRLRDKPAIVDGPSGRAMTYGQLADDVRRTAVGLSRRGFQKGDV